MKKIILYTIVSVVILALLVGVLVWVKQQINLKKAVENTQPVQVEKVVSGKEKAEEYARNWGGDTSKWKVYLNEELGFVLRYPEEVFNFRIMSGSNSVGVYSEPLPPKEFRLVLSQKGYSEDDYKHQIWMNLNSLKSEKEYYLEAEKDTVVASVLFASKHGKMFGTKENIKKLQKDYEIFLKEGTCGAETFTVVFDETKNPNGDTRSYVHVGCEGNDGNDMGRIYRAIYQSIKFF